MKNVSQNIYWLLIPIVLLVIGDETLKHIGLQRLPEEGSLVGHPLVSFAIHRNWGIAFDFPFRLEFILAFSLLIGFWLVRVALINWRRNPGIAFSSCVILIGALGNVYDRIVYGFTVDYLIFFGRSAINFSDVVIVAGAILLLMFSRRKKKQNIEVIQVDE